MSRCPRCSAVLETPLGCLACGALAPLGGSDPGPFEILGIAPSFAVDVQDLRRRLLRLSRMTHPDFFATAAPDERQRAERATAMLNAAYATLTDDAARAEHLVLSLGGPDENAERAMPPAFLEEALEWNEAIEAAKAGGEGGRDPLRALRETLEGKRAEALEAAGGSLDPLPPHGSPKLTEARRALNVVRYVDRALGEIEALRLSRAEAR